ncbi:acyltransferase [Enterovibrio sp. ZSDZ42]|uniref:Acyltransferase n=1 Tax=Enterovibrio gelatinilyticus TaxID=2899819 RepID=A0ABT5QVJ6_9GAMM|nr:acyltransferase [Enterovibrio sp. ZSDZ42]MDD1792038.1 acyltransferase [Enterovibrio sp. ZSDZ42]
MFLQSIHNYRAVAIIAIVMSHSYVYGLEDTTGIISVIKTILTGCTALFVFISGYMFHHIFYKRFEYKKFMKGKFQRIIVPYLILSTFAIILVYIIKSGFYSSSPEYSGIVFFSPEDSSLSTAIKYYLTGRMLTAYWYIPFAILLFLASPLHFKFIKLSKNTQIFTIAAFSLISVFLHRSYENINPLQMFVYYTPFYLIGIYFSLYREEINKHCTQKGVIFLSAAILLAFYQYTQGHEGSYTKNFFEYGGIDIMFFQKMFLSTGLYFILEAFVFKTKLTDIISDTSFAIFFIHPWVLTTIKRLPFLEHPESTNVPYYLVTCLVVISLSVLISIALNRILTGKIKSRYIIGY